MNGSCRSKSEVVGVIIPPADLSQPPAISARYAAVIVGWLGTASIPPRYRVSALSIARVQVAALEAGERPEPVQIVNFDGALA